MLDRACHPDTSRDSTKAIHYKCPLVYQVWTFSRLRPQRSTALSGHGQESVATDLSTFYERNWDTWEIACPSEYPQLAADEMGIRLTGPGEQYELHRYPRERLDGCTQDVDPGPHPADRRMFTEGTEPAVIVNELSQ